MKDIAFFTFSTEEDFSYVLEFSGLVLTGRSFEVKIKDRASDTTRATLTNGAGLTITGTNILEAAYAKGGMSGWPRGEYSADVVDVTGGGHSRIMAVRFVYDLPGRLVQGVRDRKAYISWSPNQAVVTSTGAIGPAGPVGPQGDEGWSPAFAVISDSARRVLQVADWVGGAGTKPATGAYVGATGLVSDIADAIDIRGQQGLTGNTGNTGATGDKGWSPILAVVTDGARRVLQVSDWTGGAGTKPASGSYVGASGLTAVLADAVDIRGAQGPAGSVTDGDKGDVNVASGGTAWTVKSTAAGIAQAVAAYVIPTRASILITAIPVVLNLIGASGYYAEGDCGAILPFKRLGSAPSPAKRWHVQSLDGAWWELAVTAIDPRMLGAKFTGSTSDAATNTAAINAALDYHELGGAVIIPPGRCYIQQDGANPWCLKQTKPNCVIGVGNHYSALIPINSTSGSVDTFYYHPDTSLGHRHACIKGLFLGDSFTGHRPGRYGIFIYTDTAGVNVSEMEISGNHIGQHTTPGSGNYSIWHTNETAVNTDGGLFSCRIEGNSLTGGIRLSGSGDSNHIERNTITDLVGNGTVGVWFSLVTGASELTIIGNNFTTRAGSVVGDSGSRTKILFNNCEHQSGTATDGAMINLRGSVATMANCEIHGNHFGAFSGTGITANVRLRNQVAPKVTHNNMLPASASTFAIDIADTANGIFSPNTIGTGGAGKITAGAGTTGIEGIFIAIALVNSWANSGGSYHSLGYVKNGATVTVTGVFAGGADGSVVSTLPVGTRPRSTVFAIGFGGSGIATFEIRANGDIYCVDGGAFNALNVTFPVSDDGWSSSDL